MSKKNINGTKNQALREKKAARLMKQVNKLKLGEFMCFTKLMVRKVKIVTNQLKRNK